MVMSDNMDIMEEGQQRRVLVMPSADNTLEAAELVRRNFEQIRLVRDADISSTVQKGVRKEGQAGGVREEETEAVDSIASSIWSSSQRNLSTNPISPMTKTFTGAVEYGGPGMV